MGREVQPVRESEDSHASNTYSHISTVSLVRRASTSRGESLRFEYQCNSSATWPRRVR
jgi:hypothetical protein